MSATQVQQPLAACENCGAALHGEFCHACGQSVHSPTRHFGHAVEEVFESFWHLDGRVFRTLRDLMVPGRVARNYLAGQRVRYIAPLRLFVILSLLTFFVGKLVVHVDQAPLQFGGEGGARIERAQTAGEVRRIEAELLKELSAAEKEAANVPGVNPALVATRARIEGAAANRIVELERQSRGDATATGAAAQPAAASGTPATKTAATAASAGAAPPRPDAATTVGEDQWRFNDKPWDEKTNPVDVGFLPGFGDRWLNHKIGRAKANLDDYEQTPDRFVQSFLGAVPTALFVLMPVFALLLKVAYLGSGRRYLEHMVVALYSHAWLLLALLAMFLLNGLKVGVGAMWMQVTSGLLMSLLWIWIPVYLFFMQHRVYRDHWAITALRYLVVGTVYMVLVTFVVAFAVLAGIAA